MQHKTFDSGVEQVFKSAKNTTGLVLKMFAFTKSLRDGPHAEFRDFRERAFDNRVLADIHTRIFGDRAVMHGRRAASGALFGTEEVQKATDTPVRAFGILYSRSVRYFQIQDDLVWKVAMMLNTKRVWTTDTNKRGRRPQETSYGAVLEIDRNGRKDVFTMAPVDDVEVQKVFEHMHATGCFVDENDTVQTATSDDLLVKSLVEFGRAYRMDIQIVAQTPRCFKVYAAGNQSDVQRFGSLGKMLLKPSRLRLQLLDVQLYQNRPADNNDEDDNNVKSSDESSDDNDGDAS